MCLKNILSFQTIDRSNDRTELADKIESNCFASFG